MPSGQGISHAQIKFVIQSLILLSPIGEEKISQFGPLPGIYLCAIQLDPEMLPAEFPYVPYCFDEVDKKCTAFASVVNVPCEITTESQYPMEY